MHPEDEKLEKLLSTWEYEPEKDSELVGKVHQRIHNQYLVEADRKEAQGRSLVRLFTNRAFLAAALVLIAGFAFLTQIPSKNTQGDYSQLSSVYRQMVDPAVFIETRSKAFKGFENISEENSANSREDLSKAMAWIADRVHLTAEQSEQFSQIHQAYYGEFYTLQKNLLDLENEYRNYERQRIAGEEINMLEVYSNLQKQKALYERSLSIQKQFVDKIFQVLDRKQEAIYGELLHAPIPQTPPSAAVIGKQSERII